MIPEFGNLAIIDKKWLEKRDAEVSQELAAIATMLQQVLELLGNGVAFERNHQRKSGLMDIYDVMERVNCGKSTIWEWIKAGKFPKPITGPGEKALWEPEDIEAHITQKKEANRR